MRIIFDKGGFPHELTEPEEWARAIRSGVLLPSTIVKLSRGGDEDATLIRADEITDLQALFRPAPAQAEPRHQSALMPLATAADRRPERATTVSEAETPEPMEEVSPPPLSPTADHIPEAPMGRQAAKWKFAGVIGTALLLILAFGLSRGGSDRVPDADNVVAPVASQVEEVKAALAGEAIAEAVPIEWTDIGTPTSYVIEGLELTIAAEIDDGGTPLPVITVRSDELGDSRIVGTPGGETARATFMVLRPSRTDRFPSVLLMTYSMGAHCCTSFKLLTPRGSGWALADLGEWDGGPLESAPIDLDGDGLLDFVLGDNVFLYAFAPYAESRMPALIYNVVNGRFVDRSTSSRFRDVHFTDMSRHSEECARRNNAACAALVASAARVGQTAEAASFVSANFDEGAASSWLPARCLVRRTEGVCPDGSEQQPSGFMEALDWFLQDNGYVTGSIVPPSEPETHKPFEYIKPELDDAAALEN